MPNNSYAKAEEADWTSALGVVVPRMMDEFWRKLAESRPSGVEQTIKRSGHPRRIIAPVKPLEKRAITHAKDAGARRLRLTDRAC